MSNEPFNPHSTESLDAAALPVSIYVSTLPKDPDKLKVLTHLLTCCFYLDTIRAQLSLMQLADTSEPAHTAPSNAMTAFLASISTLHEATSFIGKMRESHKLENFCAPLRNDPRLAQLFRDCGRSDAHIQNPALKSLSRIRNQLSSHITHNFARQILQDRFQDLSAFPLLLTANGRGWTTSSPLARRVAELHCFPGAQDDESLRAAVRELRQLVSKVVTVLFELNLWMQAQVGDYLAESDSSPGDAGH